MNASASLLRTGLRASAGSMLARNGISSRNFTTTIATSNLIRLKEHYHHNVEDDLMILNYEHVKPTPKSDLPTLSGKPRLFKKYPRKPNPPTKNHEHIPQLKKIVVHCYMKDAVYNKYNLLSAFISLQCITGQCPEPVFAKSDAAPWKLRRGMPVGCRVTLEGEKMYSFIEKVTEIVLPRMKEYQGLRENSGDGNGNIAFGFPAEAMGLFPDIEGIYDMIPKMTGFDVTVNTTGYSDTEARLLLSGFQLPFQSRRRSIAKPKETAEATA
ncbi:ribosomal protein L5 [Basidiobolus meristosporus CBS 931.73]|uniref:Large ribosomal subunit protein uL5m n=1 Tax=Basidiobolus meristosporus CBS 931.73 TaxID=1314790 RepID=A0A1Y1Y9F0_9FUNG|nr:ribosomal protein L5 [Basidiobolus meristosporus CBS 931.73]|eukprot:ORX94613.1 ribosomal protein L5 [Basidiobolus meristosporus CBS 931.73]